ncbi:MAG: hypothetical protein HYY40_14955 [Bacteroidetes bacterium]|nr:hypothetical protein [Bacteroidota bacterium]
MKLSDNIKNSITKRGISYSFADQINSEDIELGEGVLKSFSIEGQSQIELSQKEKTKLLKYKPNFIDKIANNIFNITPKRTNGEYDIKGVVNEISRIKNIHQNIKGLEDSFNFYKSETNEKLKQSILLEIFRATNKYPNEVIEFLEWSSENSSIELQEWSNLFLQEVSSNATNNTKLLSEPVSNREFVYQPNLEFDVTMPLMFSGIAYTKVGFITKSIPIPPLVFESIIGKAMALVRDDSFEERMVLQKSMYGIHPDGSPHYEIFPFLGTTQILDKNVYKHNYRTEVSRPFYPSGMTEYVGEGEHVIRGVKLSFDRVGMTTTPEKYKIDGKRLVETVRGTFFGYGDINLTKAISNGFKINNGNFQLTPRNNPFTNKSANTIFKGIFYGKLIDFNNDNKLDVNTIPINCDKEGKLDYLGDKTYQKDPFRPDDW